MFVILQSCLAFGNLFQQWFNGRSNKLMSKIKKQNFKKYNIEEEN
jgi:hypothetical protein